MRCFNNPAPHLCTCHTLPLNIPVWYPLWLDPWQLSLKYSNSTTELPNDSVAQLARAWQAICQVMGSSPSLSHSHFFPSFFLSDIDQVKVWLSGLNNWACALCFTLTTPPSHTDAPVHSTTYLSRSMGPPPMALQLVRCLVATYVTCSTIKIMIISTHTKYAPMNIPE